jgi:hypothetical protein
VRFTLIIVLFAALPCFSQVKRTKVPSYFGFMIRPVFPTQFIGEPLLELSGDGFETSIQQKVGYGFGGTVRAGLTKLIALETGINYTERNFDLYMAKPDSNSFAVDTLSFIEYDIPINALFYIQLSEKWFMNTALGISLNFKPSDIGAFNQPGGPHFYKHTGLVTDKFHFDLNANVGFEFRTEKNGFFYLGGSARVPFAPLFTLVADYTYQGNNTRLLGEVDGSFLAIDFKYFFPNIANKGPQFQKGPIE